MESNGRRAAGRVRFPAPRANARAAQHALDQAELLAARQQVCRAVAFASLDDVAAAFGRDDGGLAGVRHERGEQGDVGVVGGRRLVA